MKPLYIPRARNNITVSRVLSWIYIGVMIIVTYAPIMILVLYSFTDARAIGNWNGFTFSLYKDMLSDREILSALSNSIIIALSSSVIATIVGTAAAVGIFYMRKFPKTISNGLTQITMLNADIVTGIAFMLFFVAINVIPEGYATLIIAHTIICLPYVIMSVMPRLNQLNPNVYEAGLDLGASHMRTFMTVVMPQLVSGMVSGFMLAFTISFDDFIVSKFIKGSIQTIPVYLYNKLAKKGILPVLRALSTLLLVIVFTVLLIINIFTIRRQKKYEKTIKEA